MTLPTALHLTGGGSSVVFRVSEAGPEIIHWGAPVAPGDVSALADTASPAVMHSSFDRPRTVPALGSQRNGWSGTPALAWHRDGRHAHPRLRLRDLTRPDAHSVEFLLIDDDAEASVRLAYRMHPEGLLAASAAVTSTAGPGTAPLDLVAARLLAPLPRRADEVLDQTGRWSGERRPQRGLISDGARVRSSRRGRPGHDSPYLTIAGTRAFGFRSGEVWACHVAWSGDQEIVVDRLPEGVGSLSTLLGGAELLEPGEVRLDAGQTYSSPDVFFGWSGDGVDGLSDRFHRHLRRMPAHPRSPRPLTLNTWEAVYFDHDRRKLEALARTAAAVGVERFVLDDGWFTGRDSDRTALGDWSVDEGKWPDGLRGLAALVHGLGMQFGLWFEPEMVSPDSELARAHPDWILAARPEEAELWRHQLVLDLSNPDAWDHLYERMDATISGLGVDFVKWDHNRDVHAASGRDGRSRAHAQTAAAYRLIDAVRARHPHLEIESCASGGARIDLGILQRTQRVWASDTNDPVERQRIQLWTGVLVPPELIGSHVGPPEAHVTRRASHLRFRLATALFAHAGIEWDITGCTPAELEALRAWSAVYRELRPLIHSGTVVRSDDAGPGALLYGVVSEERDHALFAHAQLEPAEAGHSERQRFPGLDRRRDYRIRVRDELGIPSRHQVTDPAWLRSADPRLSGAALSDAGVPLPVLNPGEALLLEFRAE